MGQYINPPDMSKEDFLLKNGRLLPVPPAWPTNYEDGLVVLVSNGSFNAAGICYSRREFAEFMDSRDTRPKTWWLVNKELLAPYCPASRWEA